MEWMNWTNFAYAMVLVFTIMGTMVAQKYRIVVKELKDVELLTDRMNLLRDATEYVGKYFSIEYVRKVILAQSEDDIARIDREIMGEIDDGQINTEEDQMDMYESRDIKDGTTKE